MSKHVKGNGWAMFAVGILLRPIAAEIANRLGEAWDKRKDPPSNGASGG